MKPLEIVTLLTAILGAALGVLNTWHTYSRSRVKLKVASKIGHRTTSGPIFAANLTPAPPGLDVSKGSFVGIEIVNHSPFPVTVTEFGFLDGTNRHILNNPQLSGGRTMPPRLEFRESVCACVPLAEIPLELLSRVIPYCSTECGTIAKGRNKVWREYASIAKPRRSG